MYTAFSSPRVRTGRLLHPVRGRAARLWGSTRGTKFPNDLSGEPVQDASHAQQALIVVAVNHPPHAHVGVAQLT